MKRRSFVGLVLALALLPLSAGTASAQGGGGGGRRGMMGRQGGLQMLRLPTVQTELKMTPEQIAKLDAKQDEVRQSMQGLGGGGGGGQLSPEERQQRMDKIQEIQTKAVNDILDPTQQKRFRQLELQQQGPSALARKDVATELKLTDEQKTKIAAMQQQADADRRSAMQGVDFQSMSTEERGTLMTKMQDIQKASGEKMAALLTDAQKAQWKEMQGTPFAFRAPAGRGAAPAPATTPAAPPAMTP